MKPLNYLHINLSTGKIRPLPIKEGVVRAYLGGKTLQPSCFMICCQRVWSLCQKKIF